MHPEAAISAECATIRYAQCWEDGDVLLEGLAVQPGDTCLSIASAGDNTLALLTKRPARVIALDLSAAQLACLQLRVAAYKSLVHSELLELIGSRPSGRRAQLYRRCRSELAPAARRFWDERPAAIRRGIGRAGKFERFLALFRRRVLPLIHSPVLVARLLQGGSAARRTAIYEGEWDTWRWRALLNLFCSRTLVGTLGRDPSFFAYAESSLTEHLQRRIRHTLTALDPAHNPYLHWILTGRHGVALPYALRQEHFATIRDNLHRLEWQQGSLEAYVQQAAPNSIDRANLSDVFEYMHPQRYELLLERLAVVGRPGARLAYWNMLVPRSRPARLADRVVALDDLAGRLYQQDKALFYSRFVVEEVAP